MCVFVCGYVCVFVYVHMRVFGNAATRAPMEMTAGGGNTNLSRQLACHTFFVLVSAIGDTVHRCLWFCWHVWSVSNATLNHMRIYKQQCSF